MNFDLPKAVFCGLALIAAAIFFGPGSGTATAQRATFPPWEKTCKQINETSWLRFAERIREGEKSNDLAVSADLATLFIAYCKD